MYHYIEIFELSDGSMASGSSTLVVVPTRLKINAVLRNDCSSLTRNSLTPVASVSIVAALNTK